MEILLVGCQRLESVVVHCCVLGQLPSHLWVRAQVASIALGPTLTSGRFIYTLPTVIQGLGYTSANAVRIKYWNMA